MRFIKYFLFFQLVFNRRELSRIKTAGELATNSHQGLRPLCGEEREGRTKSSSPDFSEFHSTRVYFGVCRIVARLGVSLV